MKDNKTQGDIFTERLTNAISEENSLVVAVVTYKIIIESPLFIEYKKNNDRKKIDDFCAINKDVDKNVFNNKENEEFFADNLDDLLERIFIKAQEKLGKPIEKMQKDDKLELVRHLQKRGFFLVKGNIDKIAIRLNVSRYTIYNYLSEIKPEKNIKLI